MYVDAAIEQREDIMAGYQRILKYGKGYAGKSGHKCWIARITGTDTRFGLSREFLDPTKVEREHFNRARTMIDFTWELESGIYEASENGERWFIMVRKNKDGLMGAVQPTEERMRAILALMDAGQDFDAARKATMPQKEAAL